MMSAVADIVLTTLNARYAHASFGLRYLMANLPPELRGRAAIVEFDISQRSVDVVEKILGHNPAIVGIGVYIWNAAEAARVVGDIKRVRPELIVVLGGPEVSHETDRQPIVRDADYVITGEADLAFAELCEQLLAGTRPPEKVIAARLPEFEPSEGSGFAVQGSGTGSGVGSGFGVQDSGKGSGVGLAGSGPGESGPGSEKILLSLLNPEPRTLNPVRILDPQHNPLRLPYDLYTDHDLAHRVVYVEASRGCPFKCEFCLSSLDVPVRNVPIGAFLVEMQKLLDRGLMRFKFVDRTFNLNLNVSRSILRFFLERYRDGLFLHFEMIPDRLPEPLRELIAQFPPGALQFEVGVQTFNPDVAARITRRQDNAKLADNLRFLRERTGVHVHADLIVGLPGEDLDSFAAGFDALVALGPQEIQVGMLKRLRGTPIVRHDSAFGMIYSPHAPYEILQTGAIDFATMQRLRRFARYWELIANSGNFIETARLIWEGASPFQSFLALSDWLFGRIGRSHAIALLALAELMFEYLTQAAGRARAPVAAAMWGDYLRGGRKDGPDFLRPFVAEDQRCLARHAPRNPASVLPRQDRHLNNRV